MDSQNGTRFTAFEGFRFIASGELAEVAHETKKVIDRGSHDLVLIFDDVTGEQIELDFRGTCEDVVKRLAPKAIQGNPAAAPDHPGQERPRGPGRPRLGVVAREVTLLPRHWDWLNSQPGGASVALRKLVEEARRANKGKDAARRSQEAAYRFMSAIAGNLPGFEEAARALFAADHKRLEDLVRGWPDDVQAHLMRLTATATYPSPEVH